MERILTHIVSLYDGKEQGNLSPEGRCASYREDECTCPNPLNPNDYSRATLPVPLPDTIKQFLWKKQHKVNIDSAVKSTKATRTPDLVLYGDSITEFWTGTALGIGLPSLKDSRKVYEDLLRNIDHTLYGLGLGISGDYCTNLLYRIQNGELTSDMNPSMIWLLIGSNVSLFISFLNRRNEIICAWAKLFKLTRVFNIHPPTQDLANPGCSAEVTTACIINVVETIRDRKPNATIVLISILPRGEGTLATAADGTADDIPPLWMETMQVNQRLECFASGEPRVEFFNATNLFITNGDNDMAVNVTLMPDYSHPTAEGYRIYGGALVERALEIFNK
jgi:lysophospholipase L1-like esterase